MKTTSAKSLRLTPYAWSKLLYLRDLGNTEVGGFGISSASDLLLVEDICLIQQLCSEVTVRFDDQAVADYFGQQVDAGLPPERFARIWVHTHPGTSPQPSNTDEETFARCFGNSDWAVMFILARGGQTFARLRLNAGPGGDLVLPVEVDFTQEFPAAAQATWEQEYHQAVHVEQLVTWQPRPERRLSFARSLIECGDRGKATDSYLADPFWDDQQFYSFMESIDDRDRHPF
jgi:hypothetical protein